MQSENSNVVAVERWPTEIPLLVVVILAALGIWTILAISIIGFIYVALIGAFLFFAHLAFIAFVKGNAIRLGPDQFSELHQRVSELSARVGLTQPPDAYLLQQGGALNALATRFLRSKMIVLFSDLLDACGTNTAARDMIIGHELGHIRAGHLRGIWFLLPGLLVPFLGTAYSRAREYTCDRYGAAVCGDREGALRGLAILAAGGTHAPRVNLSAMARQRKDLNTGWMTIGTWLAPHPPLANRVTALEPSLDVHERLLQGPMRAVLILATATLIPIAAGGYMVLSLLPEFREVLEEAARQAEANRPLSPEQLEQARSQVEADLNRLSAFLDEFKETSGRLPENFDEFYELWNEHHPDQAEPVDPFDGLRYGYYLEEGGYVLWSSGPDREPGTADDLYLDSESAEVP